MTSLKTISVAAFVAVIATGSAFAKSHDQSQGADGTPGANVGSETVGPAQTLGKGAGNDRNEGKERGKSADAGKK